METVVNVTNSVIWAEKDKDARPTYSFDLTGLLPAGDGLAAASWTVANGTVVIDESQVQGNKTLLRVSGGTEQAWSALRCRWTTAGGDVGDFVMRLFIKQDAEAVLALGSALFPNRFSAVARMRRDRLMLAAANAIPGVSVSDDYIWEKLQAAEAHIGHALRVPLAPTRFFPRQPTQEQIDALAGQPWAIDPPYDYNPGDWYGDKWGLIVTRQKPIQSVVGLKFVYPSPTHTIVDVPADWIRRDSKYGHVQVVPSGTAYPTMLGGLFMSTLSGGRTLPFTVELEYVAGLKDAATTYPDLVDAIMKQAVIGIIEDSYLPQSGSISADGLSQSNSVDVGKYHDDVDRLLNGDNGNGGLMARIHGIRTLVI